MRRVFFSGPILTLLAVPAWAEPCVSKTFDRPLPNATAVETFVTDVPSAQFPAFWQSGMLDDHRYKIFSNGEGEITASDPNPNWAVDIACDMTALNCDITVNGDAPADALGMADTLSQCLLGVEQAETAPTAVIAQGTSSSPPVAPQTNDDAVEPTPQSPPNDGACGTDIVNEASDVATMQRLLTLLGVDPGPVDGFLGPASFAAMDVFVDDANWDTSIPDLISLLDTLHCERTQ